MTLLGVFGAAVAWLAVGVFALTIVALTVPLTAVYDSNGAAPHFRLTWLWGAVRLYPRDRKREKGEENRSNKRRIRKRRRREANAARRRGMLNLFRDPTFRRSLLNDLVRLRRSVRVPRIDLRLLLGFSDPADTGLAYGAVSAALALTPLDATGRIAFDDRHRMVVEPVFDREAFEVAGSAKLLLFPVVVVGTALRTAIGPTGRRLILTLWRSRNK